MAARSAARKVRVDASGLRKRRRAHNHLARALFDQRLRALHRADAAAGANRGVGRQMRTSPSFEPRPIAASRSITWISGNPANFAQHLMRRIAFERLLAALHQLDDLAVHQIDAGE